MTPYSEPIHAKQGNAWMCADRQYWLVFKMWGGQARAVGCFTSRPDAVACMQANA